MSFYQNTSYVLDMNVVPFYPPEITKKLQNVGACFSSGKKLRQRKRLLIPCDNIQIVLTLMYHSFKKWWKITMMKCRVTHGINVCCSQCMTPYLFTIQITTS